MYQPSRIVTQRVQDAAKEDDAVRIETAMILTDSHVEDATQDNRFVLAMATIRKRIEVVQPEAVLIITEDSNASELVVEEYSNDSTDLSAQATRIVEEMKEQNIPASAQSIYGPKVCHRWTERFERAGFHKDKKQEVGTCSRSVTFLHAPSTLPEYAAYNFQPNLPPETCIHGASLAISVLARGFETAFKNGT